jgi:hypothetical protein
LDKDGANKKVQGCEIYFEVNDSEGADGTKPEQGDKTKPADGTKPEQGDKTKPVDGTKPEQGDKTKPVDGDRICCKALSASCNSCAAGKSEREYCLDKDGANMRVSGCEPYIKCSDIKWPTDYCYCEIS